METVVLLAEMAIDVAELRIKNTRLERRVKAIEKANNVEDIMLRFFNAIIEGKQVLAYPTTNDPWCGVEEAV